jgi:peptide/nickel transport system ATP-binding protein
VSAPEPLLSVDRLTLDFRTRSGRVKALEEVSFTVEKGEVLGIVGESGSGKSVSAYAIMGLLDASAEIRAGRVRFAGIELLPGDGKALELVRGREIAMIFQSPRTALNPIRTVGRQIEDVLLRHGKASRQTARRLAIEALARVRIPDPARRYEAYPFELSGGMCQRVMIAMALACEPFLLIADEPTTGLDVTTQAVVMDLIRELVDETRMAAILITHDLSLAGEYCDRITVMHAGHTVETAPAAALQARPAHPYTARLIAATPAVARAIDDLAAIPGSLPDLRRAELPPCRFRDRCTRRIKRCDEEPLPWLALAASHHVRCWRPE